KLASARWPPENSAARIPFATVRLRQRVTKGAGSRTKGLLMAYKLLYMAQARWRRLDSAHLLPLRLHGRRPAGRPSRQDESTSGVTTSRKSQGGTLPSN